MLKFVLMLTWTLLGVATFAHAGGAQDELHRAIASPDDPEIVNAYLATLPEIPEGSGMYFVEGDLYLDRASVIAYLKSNSETPDPLPPGELIVNKVNGQSDYLKAPARRRLTYAVVTTSFPSDRLAKRTNQQLKSAAQDWIEACPQCGISLTEVPIEKAGKFYEKVSFVLTYMDARGGPIARAFFPSSPADDRQIVVFRDFFANDLGFDRVGVLRHEFGHILGYRHEQLQSISGCVTNEDGRWKPITRYDPHSVMHYMCGKGGSFALDLTASDIQGHRCLYLQNGVGCSRR